MGTTYMDFSTGVFHVDGDAPLTQAQVDSVWRHLPTTGASWVERGNLYVQQFDGAKAFNLGPVEHGVRGASDKVRFSAHAKRPPAAKKSSTPQPLSGWFLQLEGRPYYWSRDGRWLKDVSEAKRFLLEHEARALSNQLHGAIVIPVEALEGSKPQHATKKSPAQLQREIDEALAQPRAQSPYSVHTPEWERDHGVRKLTREKTRLERGARPSAPKRAHATASAQKIPSFKISTKDPAAMTAAEINKELDKLDKQDSTLGSLMIEAGRGHERPSEYFKMTDPLAMELRKNYDRRQDLRIEISLRYGPNPPYRLPSGRGFGPRTKTQSPTRGGMGFGKRYGGD